MYVVVQATAGGISTFLDQGTYQLYTLEPLRPQAHRRDGVTHYSYGEGALAHSTVQERDLTKPYKLTFHPLAMLRSFTSTSQTTSLPVNCLEQCPAAYHYNSGPYASKCFAVVFFQCAPHLAFILPI